MPAEDDAPISPFACQSSAAAAAADNAQQPASRRGAKLVDFDDAAMAAEAADDVAPLPDAASGNSAGGAGLTAMKSQAPGTAVGSGGFGGGGGGANTPVFAAAAAADGTGLLGSSSGSKQGKKRKLIPLKQVVRHSYEYHGLNDLFYFCITALAVTMVLYWHWGETTATFKATVQRSFQGYGNPDWQSQELINVDTMYDAVEYSMGWLEFWLQRADNIGWSNETVRIGEFGDLQYVRMLVNIDRNCDASLSPNMECYKRDDLTQYLRTPSGGGQRYENLLDWAGWQNVGSLWGRDAADAGSAKANQWWSYAIIAPKFYETPATRDNYIGRMYNVTRNSNLNYNNCDWANSTCADAFPDGPKCAQSGPQVPFSSWWNSSVMCRNKTTEDEFPVGTRAVQRGERFFARHPCAGLPADQTRTAPCNDSSSGSVLDLKPFLSKYAYSISLDVLASNAVRGRRGSDPDRALFTMTMQRSAQVKDRPDRILWQITSTVPVRTRLYSQYTDWVRIAFEVVLYICLLCILALQVRQAYICFVQHNSLKPWVAHFWNDFELLSNLTLVAWVIYYWVLFSQLKAASGNDWDFLKWDVEGRLAGDKLNAIMKWSSTYSAWLYMGIVVDLFFCMRLARYMRIHVGLKAFYQVFLIAAREFLDFAVFLFYILVLLGSAVFAFFQLTGGNYQFLRFPDGLSLMTRLTFGFLSYEDFQSQALGVGAAVSAVTLLFWLAVLLLVVYTQNIILAIVAEAYEEAKAKLGTAETSFLMLVLMRILFTLLFVAYRIKMFCSDVWFACRGNKGSLGSMQRRGSLAGSGTAFLSPGSDQGPGGGSGTTRTAMPAASSRGVNGSTNGLDEQDALDPWGGEVQDDERDVIPLAPTTSRVVLPLDVEQGLSGGLHGRQVLYDSRTNLLDSGRTSSQYAPTPPGSGAVAGADVIGGAPTGSTHAGPQVLTRTTMSRSSRSASSARSGPQGFWARVSLVWHDVILGETHLLRMYKELTPGTSKDVWLRSWKEKYWRPWCVARTAPLRCLVNLYQDFGSYKLKEECTWLTNVKAKEKITAAWRSKVPSRSQAAGLDGTGGGLKDAASGSLADGSSHGDSEMALLSFPALLNETWVDEAELARLFLVTDVMSGVMKIWFPPFRPLTPDEVSYIVKAISVVYGEDEDLVMQQQPVGDRGTALGDGGSGQLSHTLSVTHSSREMKDAQLGQKNARRGGGFFNSLNVKRRDGSAEHTRQLTWLLHANKRLEEATLRNAGHLQNANNRLERYASLQDEFQRKQQRTNSQVLKGIDALTNLLQAQQGTPNSPTAGSTGPGMDRSSSGAYLGQVGGPGSSGALSAVRRLNTMAASATSKVLGNRVLRSRSGVGGAGSEEATMLMRTTSDASPPLIPMAAADAALLGADDQEQGVHGAEASDSEQLVVSLQRQMAQQQQALKLQQELLQQVLARLPDPQSGR